MGAGTGYPNGEGARADQLSNINGVETGQETVTAPGTSVQLNQGESLEVPDGGAMVIRAEVASGGDFVYVGDGDVSSSNGFKLANGEATPPLQVGDVSQIHIDADTADDGVSWAVETTGAAADAPDPEPEPDPSVLEDFEGYADTAAMRSNYASDDLSNWNLVTDGSMEGDQHAEVVDSRLEMAWSAADGTTPRGNLYKLRLRASSADSHPGMMLEVQDPTFPLTESYVVRVDVRDDRVEVRAWGNGAVVESEDIGVDPLTNDTTYRIEVSYEDSTNESARFVCELFEDGTGDRMGSGTVDFATDITGGVLGYAGGRAASGTEPDEFDTFIQQE